MWWVLTRSATRPTALTASLAIVGFMSLTYSLSSDTISWALELSAIAVSISNLIRLIYIGSSVRQKKFVYPCERWNRCISLEKNDWSLAICEKVMSYLAKHDRSPLSNEKYVGENSERNPRIVTRHDHPQGLSYALQNLDWHNSSMTQKSKNNLFTSELW